MSEERESVFRKESLDRISSPEQLQDYLKVTNPGIWVVLVAVIVALLGLLAWSATGKLETLADAVTVIDGGRARVYLTETNKGRMEEGMVIRIDSKEYKISSSETDELGRPCSFADIDLPDGNYDSKIVMESISPIEFLVS